MRTTSAALALAGLLLVACSGNPTAPAPESSLPTGSTAPSASSTPSPAGPSSAAPTSPAPGSATPAPVELVNPCDVIDVATMSRLSDTELAAKAPSTQQGIELCRYTGSRTTPPVLAVTGRLPGTIDNAVKLIQQVAGDGDATATDVEGADEARTFSGQVAGATQVYVIASKGEVVHGAILSSPSGAGLRDKAVAITEALLGG